MWFKGGSTKKEGGMIKVNQKIEIMGCDLEVQTSKHPKGSTKQKITEIQMRDQGDKNRGGCQPKTRHKVVGGLETSKNNIKQTFFVNSPLVPNFLNLTVNWLPLIINQQLVPLKHETKSIKNFKAPRLIFYDKNILKLITVYAHKKYHENFLADVRKIRTRKEKCGKLKINVLEIIYWIFSINEIEIS